MLLALAGASASSVAAQGYRWRLVAARQNVDNAPLEATRSEERYVNWRRAWKVSSGQFVIEHREADGDDVAYDVRFVVEFTPLPVLLGSEQELQLSASVSGAGEVRPGQEPVATAVWQTWGGAVLVGREQVATSWRDGRFVSHTTRPYLRAPAARQDAEFSVGLHVEGEAPCNARWVYRAEPVPRDDPAPNAAPSATWGSLVGHVLDGDGVTVERGGKPVETHPGMPLYSGDRVRTAATGHARLCAFAVDAQTTWSQTRAALQRSPLGKDLRRRLGAEWAARLPTPDRTTIEAFLAAVPSEAREAYLEHARAVGAVIELGPGSDLGVGELTGYPGLLLYLRQGALRFRRGRGAGPRRSRGVAGVVVLGREALTPDQAGNRWSAATRAARQALATQVRADRRRYGGFWERLFFRTRDVQGLVLRPQGTDFGALANLEQQRVLLRVRKGAVRCDDLTSGHTATFEAGEASEVEAGKGGAPRRNTPAGWKQLLEAVGASTEAKAPSAPRVQSLRLFEGPRGAPVALGKQRYRESFRRDATRFVYWELTLSAPGRARRDFELVAIWRRADGTQLARQALEAYQLPQWKASAHQRGFGAAQVNNWAPGRYTVELSMDGRHLGSREFTILAPGPQAKVDGVELTATALRFYESGPGIPPVDQREFTRRFPSAQARFVNWCLFLEHDRPREQVLFDLQAVWYGPGGKELHRHTLDTYLARGWATSSHSHGRGAPEPGSFAPGRHRVEVFLGRTKLAEASFEVTR